MDQITPAASTAVTQTVEPAAPTLDDILQATSIEAQPATQDMLAWAKMMARDSFLPGHLRFALDPERTVANCFRVVAKARQWKMSPYDVAAHSYEKGGKLGFDGLITAAVVQNSGKIQGRLTFTCTGAGATMRGLVVGTLKGAKAPVSVDVVPWTGPTRSTAWDTDPVQMLWYRGVRQWTRLYLPEVFFSIDGGDDESTPISQRDLDAVKASLPAAASQATLAECLRVSRLLGNQDEVVSAAVAKMYQVESYYHLTQAQADQWLASLRQQHEVSKGQATDHSQPPVPPATPTATPAGGASATLQEALAEQQRAAAVPAGAPVASEAEVQREYLSTLESYYSMAATMQGRAPYSESERTEMTRKMVAKRGVLPLVPVPVPVMRQLIETLDARVAEWTQQRQANGTTCAAPAVPVLAGQAKR